MRKSLLTISVAVLFMFIASIAFAAAWNVPTNVRVVQKSNTDTTGRIYGTIQAAINSITNASASNPYLVKVMPGVYDQGTGSIQMKAYVDVEGSGPENTVIVSSNASSAYDTCSIATVIMANNSSIRNIQIVNNPPQNNENLSAALTFENVNGKAEGISIFVIDGPTNANVGRRVGICSWGSAAKAEINNAYLETRSNGTLCSDTVAVFYGASFSITNSKLSAFNDGGDVTLITSDGSGMGSIDVANCKLEGTATGWLTGIMSNVSQTSITDSTITLNAVGSWGFYANTPSGMLINNTRFISSGSVEYYFGDLTRSKISNSLLPGSRGYLAGGKCINDYDENYNLIQSNCL